MATHGLFKDAFVQWVEQCGTVPRHFGVHDYTVLAIFDDAMAASLGAPDCSGTTDDDIHRKRAEQAQRRAAGLDVCATLVVEARVMRLMMLVHHQQDFMCVALDVASDTWLHRQQARDAVL